MRPLSLKWQDVHSFAGEHEIDLSSVTLAVLSGQNGAGKSSIAIDLPLFALFGETRGSLDSIVREGADSARVEFKFALGDDVYLVSRSRSQKGSGSTLLSFQMLMPDGPVVLDAKSVAETQAKIESILHMNAALLRMTAFSTQGDAAAFSQAKPAERKAVLGDILDLGTWERRAQVARALGQEAQGELARAEDKRGGAQALGDQRPATELELADFARQGEAAAADLASWRSKAAAAQGRKESLIEERERIRAQHAEFAETEGRLGKAKGAAEAASARLAGIERAIEGKPEAEASLKRAEAAQAEAEAWGAKRQADDRLAADEAMARQALESARQERERSLEALRAAIANAEAGRKRELAAASRRRSDLEAQARPLGDVPCRGTENEPRCPLIAGAREALAKLDGANREVAELEKADPARADRSRLAQVEKVTPGEAEEKRLQALAVERRLLGYDAEAHAMTLERAKPISAIREALERMRGMAALVPEIRAALDASAREAAELAERLAALGAALGPHRDWEREAADIEAQIGLAEAQAVEAEKLARRLAQARGMAEERLAAIERAEDELVALDGQAAILGRRIEVLKVLAQAFGKQGIPALLIEKAVPDLEAVADDVLGALSDGHMSVALHTQRETKAKTLQETLEIVVSDERGERAYENYSGGEAMRVDLALRVALSQLLASRAGARCELLVLDETCAPLDAQGRMLFVDCLQRVAERFATILVVTHIEELKELFPFRFEVSKGAEGSRVEMVAA